jgi:small subunit ribosomal protein S6
LETALKRLYEGMFLVDSALAAQDWQVIIDEVQRVMDRAEAEVISLKKWDERRLCYEVQKKSRGTYILAYFNCETSKIGGIERDVQLSELLTRVLVLRTDRMTPEDLEKLTPLEAVAAEEAERAAAAEERAKVAAEAAEVAAAEAAATEEATADTEPEAAVATDAVADAEVSEAPEETEPAPAPEKTDDTAEEKAE